MIWLGGGALGSALLGTASLTTGQQITCWVLGAFSLVVNVILKQIPMDKLKGIQWPDLESETKEDQLSKTIDQASSAYKQRVDDLMSAGA